MFVDLIVVWISLEKDEELNQMNVLLVLDVCMHDNILDVLAPYPLALVCFVSQDDPGAKYLS